MLSLWDWYNFKSPVPEGLRYIHVYIIILIIASVIYVSSLYYHCLILRSCPPYHTRQPYHRSRYLLCYTYPHCHIIPSHSHCHTIPPRPHISPSPAFLLPSSSIKQLTLIINTLLYIALPFQLNLVLQGYCKTLFLFSVFHMRIGLHCAVSKQTTGQSDNNHCSVSSSSGCFHVSRGSQLILH